MFIKVNEKDIREGPSLMTKCPACGHDATFTKIGGLQDIFIPVKIPGKSLYLGQRMCPNPSCFNHIFFIQAVGGEILATFPPLRIDFDSKGIPPNILAVFEEAVACHANQCFIASAIMIRKTLEEICKERGSSGNNLKERINALGNKIVIPKELLEGMDELRMLGNDAAHFESQVYDKIGKEEVDIAFEFTKEILKAVYQYEHLLTKLRSLKKP